MKKFMTFEQYKKHSPIKNDESLKALYEISRKAYEEAQSCSK